MIEARPGVRYGCCECCESTEVTVSEEQTEDVRDDDLGAILMIKNAGGEGYHIFVSNLQFPRYAAVVIHTHGRL